ncbi:E1-like protein-activating [Multifurca ochricompacta]|uniref:Ubiquitin-like modifier-activating enzyme ATG7 n=1 Tax=Multifurca ochricompacta TaxID=376703 RepID=A0AAD4M2P7_9AGAM|nr:E1-like protein-activating [Multifurca ochricompacta]
MPVVQFAQFSSLVQPTFWHELSRLKLEILRLSDESIPLSATYSAGRTVKDRNTGQDVALGCNISVGGEGFSAAYSSPPHSVSAQGFLKNYNTIEEFRNADKRSLFNKLSDEIWDSSIKHHDISALTRFLVITFADLKTYKFYYWFAFPAFAAQPLWEIDRDWTTAEGHFSETELSSLSEQLSQTTRSFFLVRPTQNGGGVEIAPVEEFFAFFANVPQESQTIGFLDPSAQASAPGWPLRNLLAYLRAVHPEATQVVRVLCWRGDVSSSRFGVLRGGPTSAERPSAVGWEKNVQGKLGARVADLAPMMDPKRLADQAVDLNLKLMRWRILPALNLEKIAQTRCLLLGAGTLGCYVARTLMGWGVRKITLVDSGRVSFSNPVRQPLFEFDDCLQGGKPKAEAAAERLKKIFPGVDAQGVTLSIPMPGHPITPGGEDQTKADVKVLEDLFDGHDAVFLLMDSRESRWLPTVLGSAKGKIVLNAALGFDSYLVMRHGAREKPTEVSRRLGCYYCNDIVAPADSLTDRTLDQMCTVTRPGLAPIASATAVELLVSLLQHPLGLQAPAPFPGQNSQQREQQQVEEEGGSVLGLVPHQLRGFLAQFRTMPIVGAAFDRCTGCSETVLKAYETQGFEMLLRAFNKTGYLENLTGLDKLHAEGEQALEAVDWDEEEEEKGADDDF